MLFTARSLASHRHLITAAAGPHVPSCKRAASLQESYAGPGTHEALHHGRESRQRLT